MNNKFEQWIREVAPETQIDEINKEAHLAVLKERLRKREAKHRRNNRRQRNASMFFVILLFSFGGGAFSPLGSDGFEFLFKKRAHQSEDMISVEMGLREHRFSTQADISQDNLMDLATQLEAGIGEPIGLKSIQIDGAETWNVGKNYLVDGEIVCYWGESSSRKDIDALSLFPFLVEESSKMENEVDSGVLQPVETRNVLVDGVLYDTKVYKYQSKKYGEVTFLKGTPIIRAK